ncbi:MAG: hypothetical protein GC159_13240 [Phycisphaera sp.]|nr:hypothetical protein [Phycisphaera sp.]
MGHETKYPGGMLCPTCITANDPAAHFCKQCGAPLSAYAATAPFERIFATGDTYRKATDPTRPIVLIGMWLLFGPNLLILAIVLILRSPMIFSQFGLGGGPFNSGMLMPIDASALALSGWLEAWILWVTTSNYLRHFSPHADADVADDDDLDEREDVDVPPDV